MELELSQQQCKQLTEQQKLSVAEGVMRVQNSARLSLRLVSLKCFYSVYFPFICILIFLVALFTESFAVVSYHILENLSIS